MERIHEKNEEDFGELANLSTLELFQLYEDAHNSTMDTEGVQAIVVAILNHRGTSIGKERFENGER